MLSDHVIFADWPAPPTVRALSTTRTGGMSHRPYDSMNLATHVGDDPRYVRQNRDLLRTELQLPKEPAWLNQQHSRGVVLLERAGSASSVLPADASVTRKPGLVCAVQTADCLPVLLCDTDGTRVAAIHAGWRGLASGVIEAAVAHLEPHGRHLLAWLGPCIGPQSYEIDAPVRARLLASTPGADEAFTATRPGHWRADLCAIARRQLASLGIHDVFGGELCTYDDSSRFYSHRREGVCGRMASLIWLDD